MAFAVGVFLFSIDFINSSAFIGYGYFSRCLLGSVMFVG